MPAAPSRRVVRPPAFRFPYARAAALLLLVGGTAFVFDRAGTSARGRSTHAESVMADAAAGSDLAATAPAEAAATVPAAPIQAPEPTPVGATLPTGAGRGATGNARRESAAPRRAITATTTDGATRARSAERSARQSEPAPATFAERGVAGGVAGDVAMKNAVPLLAQPSIAVGRDAAPEVASPTALPAAPPPLARMDIRLQERAVAGALNLVPPVVRYRTKEGIIITLTEEPLRTTFAEESVATVQSAPPSAQRMAAAMAAPPVNSYRWASVERGKTYTLSGPLTVAELEALSKKLSELERLP